MNVPDLSVVIPVYNEKDNLPELIDRCLAACKTTGRHFEIILVDDGSRDGSRNFISQAADRHPEVIGVMLNRNYGQHAAVIAGLDQSSGEIVVTLDADLQNPPEEIPNLVREMDRGVDVVGTVRENRQDSVFRRVPSALINWLVRRTTGVMMHDYGCMLRAYRRPIVDAMLQCRERSTFIPILANSFAGSTAEIPVRHALREKGESKYGFLKLISLQFDLLTSMSTFPLRLLSFMGAVIAACGIGFGVLLMVMRFAYGDMWAAEGVFTLFAVLFVFIGAQFIGLGLLGEYIGRIYNDVRSRPRFFIQEICGANPSAVEGKSTLSN
ncbi:MAG: glycosyltransferase [Desulfobacterales bacterium]|nr:glycosyltransferase [Desulfobacterales bacterium]MDD4071658.1 glycosyltransferase [Desulfobacterales bacterium]MDD4393569.1 glycosyltransferase [Desulfobacterales bacterium]